MKAICRYRQPVEPTNISSTIDEPKKDTTTTESQTDTSLMAVTKISHSNMSIICSLAVVVMAVLMMLIYRQLT